MSVWMLNKAWSLGVVLVLLTAPFALHAQSTPLPVKPGLWEMQTGSNGLSQGAAAPTLPPEAEAKIAALPPAQQAQVRAMMSGAGGGAARPAAVPPRKVCLAGQPNLDSILNQSQRASGMQCTFTNRAQTARGVSFDTSCTGPHGNAKGHTEFHLVDDEHLSGSTHMTVTGSAQGHDFNSTIDTTTSGKFLADDCGDVKPFTPGPQGR
jgi:hypothetical protein